MFSFVFNLDQGNSLNMIKTGVNVMYKFLSIIDYQTYLKFAINEKNRKDKRNRT